MSKSKNTNKKLWRIHNWVGLYAGIVIAVLSVTGVVALFKVEIDEAINGRYYKIAQPDDTADFHPGVHQLIDSLRSVYGAKTFSGVLPSTDKSKNWIAGFGVRGKNPLDIQSVQVFFNPYTAEVVGTRDYFQTFAHYIRHIHVRLFIGLFGRMWVGLGGIALLVSTITGILIYGEFMKNQFFGAIRNKNLKLKSADYHKVIGVTTLLFNLMISITGAWLGLQALLQPALMVKSPERYERIEKPISSEVDVDFNVDYVKAYKIARKLFPDLDPVYIRQSRDGSRSILIGGDVPQTAYQGAVNSIVLDKADYSELSRYDVRTKSLGDKVYYAQEGLHYGDFGGIWVKVIYSFLGFTSGALAILGFVLYLERTKSKQKQKVNYKTTGVRVWRWSAWILGACVLLYILTIIIGPNIPTVVITLGLFGTLLFFLFRPLVLFLKRKFKSLVKKQA